MKNKSTLLLIIGIAVILVGAVFAYNKLGALYTPENYLPTSAASDKPKIDAPDFAVYDMDGNSVLLSEIGKGKKVVLNFWATWCKYCKEEMPDFDEVYKEMGDDVVFMMINLPYTRGESVEKAKEYIAENGFSFPVYFDNDQDVYMNYDVSGLPATYIINSDGTFFGYTQGRLPKDALVNAINNAY
ncbi:MAG: TlpA family protein disulfide reductase [Clostridia bacterium]|nr:TlpA family protein disulfide reductase [Clostridia bacterium]